MSINQHIPKGPFYDIGMFAGGFPRPDENPNGHANWWNVDPASNINLFDANTGMRLYANSPETAVENLEERIRYGYVRGARHFFLNRPMGTTGVDHVSAAAWETIEITKRTLMANKLKWIAGGGLGEPVHLVPFIGSGMISADSLEGWEGPDDPADGFWLGDVSTPTREAATNGVLDGYLTACGCAGLMIDHSSAENERAHFIALANDLWASRSKYLLGEALPTNTDVDGVPYATEWSQDAIDAIGWIGTDNYFSHPNRTFATRPYLDRRSDPNTTRIFAWLTGASLSTDEEYMDAYEYHISLGRYIITNNLPVIAREVQRQAYPGKRIECIAWRRDPSVTYKAMHESIIVDPRPYSEDTAGAQQAAADYITLGKARQADGKWAAFRFWQETQVGPEPTLYNREGGVGENWWENFGAFEANTPPAILSSWWQDFCDAVNADQSFKLDYAYHDLELNCDFWAVPSSERQAFFEPVTIDDENNPYPGDPNPYIGQNIWSTGSLINDQFLQEYGEFARQDRVNNIRTLTGDLVLPEGRYSNYSEFNLDWEVGSLFNRHNRLPVPKAHTGNVSSPVVYLDHDPAWPLLDADPEYITAKEIENRRRWKRMLYKINQCRSCASEGSTLLHPWIAPPGYGYAGRDSWCPPSALPFEKMLWRMKMAHLEAMGIDTYIMWNPSSSFNPNAADTDAFCDEYFFGRRTSRSLDRTLPRIDAASDYDYNIDVLTTNEVVTNYSDVYEITTLYYRRSEDYIYPYTQGFGTADSPFVINSGSTGDAELAAMLVAIGLNQDTTPATQEVDVRSQTIGTADRDGEIQELTVSAEEPITGEWRAYIKKKADGSVVYADTNLLISADRSGTVTFSNATSVSKGDIIGVETISVAPDVRLKAKVAFKRQAVPNPV